MLTTLGELRKHTECGQRLYQAEETQLKCFIHDLQFMVLKGQHVFPGCAYSTKLKDWYHDTPLHRFTFVCDKEWASVEEAKRVYDKMKAQTEGSKPGKFVRRAAL